MRVSQVNDKPVPMEIPVTLTTCNKKKHSQGKHIYISEDWVFKMCEIPFCTGKLWHQSAHRWDWASLLTAIDNATAASSVFPRWPQNTVLTKLIIKIINWEITWSTKKNTLPVTFLFVYTNVRYTYTKINITMRCHRELGDTLSYGSACFMVNGW